MFYIPLTVDWTVHSGLSVHMVRVGSRFTIRKTQRRIPCHLDLPRKHSLLQYTMTPSIPWYFDALLRADYAEMQIGKQSGQTPSLHHSCYHNTSSHHHFLP